MADDRNKQLFLSLIYSFQMQAMMQMGKLANPMTNQVERELEGAQVTIDMLDMLKERTRGNISDEEVKFLGQVIGDLKLNFVEERDKKVEKDSNPPEPEKTNDDQPPIPPQE